jgi:hypothetical protein
VRIRAWNGEGGRPTQGESQRGRFKTGCPTHKKDHGKPSGRGIEAGLTSLFEGFPDNGGGFRVQGDLAMHSMSDLSLDGIDQRKLFGIDRGPQINLETQNLRTTPSWEKKKKIFFKVHKFEQLF